MDVHWHLQLALGVVFRVDCQVVEHCWQGVDSQGVVRHPLSCQVFEVHVELIDARRVVQVGHDLRLVDPCFFLDPLAGPGVQGLQHRGMASAEIPEGP